MTRKILSILAVILCEAIIIAAFIIYRGATPTDVLILDIVLCSIILGLVSVDLFMPWNDKHTSNLGSMGVRWTITSIYALATIAIMIWLHDSPFKLQILVQGALLIFLLLGLAAMLRTREQVVRVHEAEGQKLAHRDDVKKVWRDLLEKMNMQSDIPAEVREKTEKLVQEMRYLSPTNNPEALETDQKLAEGAQAIGRMVGDYRMNNDLIEQKLSQCERMLQRRRTQYSN
jgi:hypothetical protein